MKSTERGKSSVGWIKLHRSILEDPVFHKSTPIYAKILITIMLMANSQENSWVKNKRQYNVQPGQFVSSLDKIAEKAGKRISSVNVRDAIKYYVKLGFIGCESTNRNRKITIKNWQKYQSKMGENQGLGIPNQKTMGIPDPIISQSPGYTDGTEGVAFGNPIAEETGIPTNKNYYNNSCVSNEIEEQEPPELPEELKRKWAEESEQLFRTNYRTEFSSEENFCPEEEDETPEYLSAYINRHPTYEEIKYEFEKYQDKIPKQLLEDEIQKCVRLNVETFKWNTGVVTSVKSYVVNLKNDKLFQKQLKELQNKSTTNYPPSEIANTISAEEITEQATVLLEKDFNATREELSERVPSDKKINDKYLKIRHELCEVIVEHNNQYSPIKISIKNFKSICAEARNSEEAIGRLNNI